MWTVVLGEIKQVKGNREWGGVGICYFIRRVSKGLTHKVKLQQTPNGRGESCYDSIREENIHRCSENGGNVIAGNLYESFS